MCSRGKAELFPPATGLLWQCAVVPYARELFLVPQLQPSTQDLLQSLDQVQNKAGGKA